MKIAYIAHPISGDVAANLSKIVDIVREINLNEPNTVPFAPYYLDCIALNDDVPEERRRCIRNDVELFKRGFIDEVRLYGECISKGMHHEIKLAKELGILIIPMTDGTRDDFYKIKK